MVINLYADGSARGLISKDPTNRKLESMYFNISLLMQILLVRQVSLQYKYVPLVSVKGLSLRSLVRRGLRLAGVLGFNHRAHRCGFVQIHLQVAGYPRSQLPCASLSLNLVLIHQLSSTSGSSADGTFTSAWIYGIHQLSILPYLVSVISCQMWQNHNYSILD